jgi:hypothetical protein
MQRAPRPAAAKPVTQQSINAGALGALSLIVRASVTLKRRKAAA